MFHKPIDEMFPNPPAGLDAHALREDAVPQHVAVIMDGNGRWAKKRALNRLKGHKAGIAAVPFILFRRKTGNVPKKKSWV